MYVAKMVHTEINKENIQGFIASIPLINAIVILLETT